MSKLKPRRAPKCKIMKMKDTADDNRVYKENTFNLPMKLIVVGKSDISGKSNFVGNILIRPYDKEDTLGQEFYYNDFQGENIYIVCPSTLVDFKWENIIKVKQIPEQNIYNRYDEKELADLYDRLEREYMERKSKGEQQVHTLVIMDDCSFGGSLKEKMNGALSKFFCNGRHYLISTVVTSQKYSDILTTCRENATGMILFGCSYKQKELIYGDIGEQPKKEFMKMYNKATGEEHSFMIVNYTNSPEKRFLDQYFNPIDGVQAGECFEDTKD